MNISPRTSIRAAKKLLIAPLVAMVFSLFGQQAIAEVAAPNPPVEQKAAEEAAASPDEIKVGLFITSLYNINFADNQFAAQFWAWFNHSRKSFQAQSGIELPNAKTSRIISTVKEDRDGVTWAQAKYEAIFSQYWDIKSYPFDRQVLRMILECSDADAEKVRFVADKEGSRLSDEVVLDGWQIKDFRITDVAHTYKTSYGDPSLSADGPSSYSRVTAELEIKRSGWRLLFYNFLGFVFAISLSGVVLFINAFRHLSETIVLATKVAMGTGALFASVGAAYVLQARLPTTTAFTFADAIQATAFLGTLLAVLSSLIAEALTKAKRVQASLWMGRVLVLFFAALLALDAYLLVAAVNS